MKVISQLVVGVIAAFAAAQSHADTQVTCVNSVNTASWQFAMTTQPSMRLDSGVVYSIPNGGGAIGYNRVAQYSASSALLYMMTDDAIGNITYTFIATPAVKLKGGHYPGVLNQYLLNKILASYAVTCTNTPI